MAPTEEDETKTPPESANRAGAGTDASPAAQVLAALTANLVKVATALGTTAGFLTLVAGTGGAVLWARSWAAGLPADQALAVVPKNELIAAGALTLGVYVVLGLIAVAGVYAIDEHGRATTNMTVGLSALVTAELVVVVLVVEDLLWKRLVGIAVCGGLLAFAFVALANNWLVSEEGDAGRRASGDAFMRLQPKAFGFAAVAAIAIAALFFLLYPGGSRTRDLAPAVSVIVASALAAICFGVADSSRDRFWPYAIAVFFSVIIFGAVFSTWRLFEHPRMNPVGLLRTAHSRTFGVIGLLVARRDDRYWLAAASNRCEDGYATDDGVRMRGRIFSIPRSEIIDDEVGALIDLDKADEQARALLREVIRRHAGDDLPPMMRRRSYTDKLMPHAVDPCGRAQGKPREATTGTAALHPVVRVLREAGEPRLLLLDATGSHGSIAKYRWVTGDGQERFSPFIRYRVPRRRRSNITVTLQLTGRHGETRTTITIVPPIANRTLFDVDKARITKGGGQKLLLLRNDIGDVRRVQRVYVEGHTDNTGSETHNRGLSERRAEAVIALLVRSLRVPRKVFVARGFGEQVPVASNETPAGRRLNRRVEVLVVRRK